MTAPHISSGSPALAALASACTDLRPSDEHPLLAAPGVADHEAALAGHDPATCDAAGSDGVGTAVAALCPANQCTSKVMVIGCDDRQLIPPGTDATTTAPWRHVGRLSNGCSGTLIGPKHVLTAAHCVMGYGAAPIGFSLASISARGPGAAWSWRRRSAPVTSSMTRNT